MKTKVSRKCTKCYSWTDDADECAVCGNVVNSQLIAAQEREQKKEALIIQKPDVLDKWIGKWKNSENVLLKGLYYSALGIWAVYSFIVYVVMLIVTAAAG